MTPPPTEERRSYDVQIVELQGEVGDLKDEVIHLKDTIKCLRTDIHDLVYAYNTAKGVTSFIKWVAGVITACAVVYAFLKGTSLK